MEMVKKEKKKEVKKKKEPVLMMKKKSVHEVSEKRIADYGKKKRKK